MNVDKALSILKKYRVPSPYVQQSIVYDPDAKPREWWEVCSYGVDNHCVVLLGSGPTIMQAMQQWWASQPSLVRTHKSRNAL